MYKFKITFKIIFEIRIEICRRICWEKNRPEYYILNFILK